MASGADEPVTVSLNAAIDNVATGLFSQNVSIVFDVISATQVNGVAGARTVFTLVQTAGVDTVLGTPDDVFTFTLLDQVDHVPLATGAGDAETIALSLASVFVATDFDGDTVRQCRRPMITVDDDTPIATAGTSTGTVDEDGVVEGIADAGAGDGIAGGTGDVAGQAVIATGSVTALFQSGADEPLSYGFTGNAIATLQALGLTSGGVALSYAIVADTVTASAPAGNTVFTFQLTGGGELDIHAG